MAQNKILVTLVAGGFLDTGNYDDDSSSEPILKKVERYNEYRYGDDDTLSLHDALGCSIAYEKDNPHILLAGELEEAYYVSTQVLKQNTHCTLMPLEAYVLFTRILEVLLQNCVAYPNKDVATIRDFRSFSFAGVSQATIHSIIDSITESYILSENYSARENQWVILGESSVLPINLLSLMYSKLLSTAKAVLVSKKDDFEAYDLIEYLASCTKWELLSDSCMGCPSLYNCSKELLQLTTTPLDLSDLNKEKLLKLEGVLFVPPSLAYIKNETSTFGKAMSKELWYARHNRNCYNIALTGVGHTRSSLDSTLYDAKYNLQSHSVKLGAMAEIREFKKSNCSSCVLQTSCATMVSYNYSEKNLLLGACTGKVGDDSSLSVLQVLEIIVLSSLQSHNRHKSSTIALELYKSIEGIKLTNASRKTLTFLASKSRANNMGFWVLPTKTLTVLNRYSEYFIVGCRGHSLIGSLYSNLYNNLGIIPKDKSTWSVLRRDHSAVSRAHEYTYMAAGCRDFNQSLGLSQITTICSKALQEAICIALCRLLLPTKIYRAFNSTSYNSLASIYGYRYTFLPGVSNIMPGYNKSIHRPATGPMTSVDTYEIATPLTYIWGHSYRHHLKDANKPPSIKLSKEESDFLASSYQLLVLRMCSKSIGSFLSVNKAYETIKIIRSFYDTRS